jgi:hypothetical protein
MTALSPEYAAAQAWYYAGCTPIPIRLDGTKSPVGEWKQHNQPGPHPGPEQALAPFLAAGPAGVAIVCGRTSGNLEMLEFEGTAVNEGVWDAVEQAAGAEGHAELWARVVGGYHEVTPKGGVHLFYRIADEPVTGNTKIAERPARPDEWTAKEAENAAKGLTPKRTLIETRGQGGYVIVAPTRAEASDPAGPYGQRPWSLSWGAPATVATITAAERAALHGLCRRHHVAPPDRPAPPPTAATLPFDGQNERPGDRYGRENSWGDILVPLGWMWLYHHGGKDYWARAGGVPGKVSATTTEGDNGHLYVFSTSTAFDPEVPYTKFGAMAVIEHGGNHRAAASALAGVGASPYPILPAYIPPWMGEAMAGGTPPPGGPPHAPAAFTIPEGTNPVVAAALLRLGARLRTTDQLDDVPLPHYIVNDWLKADEIAQIIGASGSMKSFVAIDLAAHIATGRQWHRHDVEQRNTLFVAAEGGSGIRKRVRAWEKHHGTKATGLTVLDEPVQIAARMGSSLVMSPEWIALAELVYQTRTGVLFVDTQARSTVGVKENDNTEMGAVFDFVDALRRAVKNRPGGHDVTIVLVHHTGKAGAEGRGASAMYAAVNTELRVSKREAPGGGQQITVTNSKNKDDAEAAAMAFTPAVVGLEPDELTADGSTRPGDEATTSLVMVAAQFAAPVGGRPAAHAPEISHAASMVALLAHEVIEATPDGDVSTSIIYSGLERLTGKAGQTADARKKAGERAVNDAIRCGVVSRRSRGVLVITGVGREHVSTILPLSLPDSNEVSPTAKRHEATRSDNTSDQANDTKRHDATTDGQAKRQSDNSAPYVVRADVASPLADGDNQTTVSP